MQPDQIAAGLLDASLPQAEWTHHGHLTAAHVLISAHGPSTTLALCRERIPLLNDAHGVANSDTGGYHETLSVFFVAAGTGACCAQAELTAIASDANRAVAEEWCIVFFMGSGLD